MDEAATSWGKAESFVRKAVPSHPSSFTRISTPKPNMTRTKHKKRGKKGGLPNINIEGTGKTVGERAVDAKNEKKRKREEKKPQDSATIEADESSNAPNAKKTKTNNEDTRNNDETIPATSTEQPPSEDQPAKGPATRVSGTAPQVFGDLANLHDILIMSVISSSKIQKKTTAVLKHLATYPAVPPAKPALVLAHSKADTTAKLITVIEIAKRDIGSSGGKWFQYNVVYQVMQQQKEKGKKKDSNKHKDTAEVDDEQEAEDKEEQLETMKTPFERAIEGQPKVRAIPHLAIYLSRIRIESLRKKHG